MTKVRFGIHAWSFDGTFDEGAIAKAIVSRLPIAAAVMRWGQEIYFDVPVKVANTAPTREVTIGDIGYWPDGPCLCIFFGKTPASKGTEPRPASDVTIVGHTDADPTLLRAIAEGTLIRVEAAPRSAPASSAPVSDTRQGV